MLCDDERKREKVCLSTLHKFLQKKCQKAFFSSHVETNLYHLMLFLIRSEYIHQQHQRQRQLPLNNLVSIILNSKNAAKKRRTDKKDKNLFQLILRSP